MCCGKEITGRIHKLYCSDACRKYFKRNGGISHSGVVNVKREFSEESSQETEEQKNFREKVANRRKQSAVEIYAYKKLIDIGANLLEGKLLNSDLLSSPFKNPLLASQHIPLKVQSDEVIKLANALKAGKQLKLSEEFKSFLGNISYPFKMLVWGKPGEGKSTFCMRLANEIANQYCILYVSGEEQLTSDTLIDKQDRTIEPSNKKDCFFINRLPKDEQEWKIVLEDKTQEKLNLNYVAIFYDSISKLGITPAYIDATSRDCAMSYFNKQLSHIFISHAYKDGSAYKGEGDWGHEVDIVIKCTKGIAITEKNRFGTEGKNFKIY